MPRDLAEWLHELPTRLPSLYEKLVEHGVVTHHEGHGRRTLTELLYGVIVASENFEEKIETCFRNGNDREDARRKAMALHPEMYEVSFVGWFQSLLSAGNTTEYVLLRTSRARIVVEGCGFEYYDDLDSDEVKTWLARQRKTNKDLFGNATSNHHLKAAKAFAEWARKKLKRDHERSALEELRSINEAVDVRRKRRAPGEGETRKLLNAVKTVGTLKGLSAEDRAMLYRFVLTMGLRAFESSTVTPESFSFSDTTNEVKVVACYSKAKREDVLPIPKSLARKLKPWIVSKAAGAPLWPGTWANDAAEMLRVDLDAAGIPYKTDEGYFDFHATRHGAITAGGRVMSITKLMQFARHTKIETSMRYNHLKKEELADAVSRLPNLPGDDLVECAKAETGAADAPVSPDHKSDHDDFIVSRSMSSADMMCPCCETKISPDEVRAYLRMTLHVTSEGDGARTRNHRIDSPVL
jgi:hypothetical protein